IQVKPERAVIEIVRPHIFQLRLYALVDALYIIKVDGFLLRSGHKSIRRVLRYAILEQVEYLVLRFTKTGAGIVNNSIYARYTSCLEEEFICGSSSTVGFPVIIRRDVIVFESSTD